MWDYPIVSILTVVFTGWAVARYSKPWLNIVLKRMARLFPKELEADIAGQAKAPYSLLIFWGIGQAGFQFVSVGEKWKMFLYQPLKVILAYSLLLLCWRFLDILEKYIALYLEKNKTGSVDSITKNILPYSKKILKILTALISILLLLQNSGFNVTSLLAGLGLGGIAIALAAKETLSNFFGGFTVISDKPFSVGDWIACDQAEGTVEDIGFRSTKIKTFYDSVLTIPNAALANSIIDNLGKRKARRTRITLDITYDSSPEKIEAFVEGIKSIIKSNPCTRKDYYQCYFSGYGPHSLQILLNFFLKVGDWDTELLQKQNIFLEILRLAKELNVEFAFPTQTVELPAFSGEPQKKPPSFSAKELREKALSFGPQGALSRPKGAGVSKPKD